MMLDANYCSEPLTRPPQMAYSEASEILQPAPSRHSPIVKCSGILRSFANRLQFSRIAGQVVCEVGQIDGGDPMHSSLEE